MTKQIYKSAQGKSIDLGTIKLRNEHVRAVGNMNVNARGDVVDSANNVIDPKNRQIQRQNAKLTNVSDATVHSSSAAVRRSRNQTSDTTVADPVDDTTPVVEADPVDDTTPVVEAAPVDDTTPVVEAAPVDIPATGGGLAAAIARSKIIKQEKEKTARQLSQDTPGIRKI
jgi:hypothetical protein